MMRIAWLTDEAPDRRHGGGGIRQANLLAFVAERSECELFTTGGPPDPRTAAALSAVHDLGARPVGRPSRRWRRRFLDLWLLGPAGPSEVYDAAPARRLLLMALRSEGPFDLVHVEHAGLAHLARSRRSGEHWSMTLQNLASARAEQQLAVTEGGRQRFLVRRERARTRALERWVVDHFDLVTCVSQLDADLLGGAALVVDNGVDLAAFSPSPLPGPERVVITASLGYQPNVDGVQWFVDEVWPAVRAAQPTIQLDVVGRNPTPDVLALHGRDGVSVYADVESVEPFLARARVALVPLRVGSGTRLKALEAMASGRPVVGTTIGLEGLGVVPGVQACVADDPAQFAASVLELLSSDARAQAMAVAGRRYVEEHHDWQRLGQRYWDHLLQLHAER